VLSFVISNPLGLLMAEHFNWRSAFLIVTVLSVPSLALLAWIRDRPEQNGVGRPRGARPHLPRSGCRQELQADRFNWRDAGRALRQWSVLWMIVRRHWRLPNVAHRDVGHVRAHRGLQAW